MSMLAFARVIQHSCASGQCTMVTGHTITLSLYFCLLHAGNAASAVPLWKKSNQSESVFDVDGAIIGQVKVQTLVVVCDSCQCKQDQQSSHGCNAVMEFIACNIIFLVLPILCFAQCTLDSIPARKTINTAAASHVSAVACIHEAGMS